MTTKSKKKSKSKLDKKKSKNYSSNLTLNKLKVKFIIAAIVVIILICMASIFALFETNSVGLADFTDNVLRPIIGNNATITIESLFFNVIDHTNQVKYSFQAPNSQIFTQLYNIPKNINAVSNSAFAESTIIPPLTQMQPLPGEGVWTPVVFGPSSASMIKTFV